MRQGIRRSYSYFTVSVPEHEHATDGVAETRPGRAGEKTITNKQRAVHI